MPSHKLQKKQGQQQRVLKKNFKDDLLKWICERHATNSPLDRKLLRQKALQLSQALEIINFKCSEQWMTMFLKRYGFSPSLTSCDGPYFKDYHLWVDLMRPLLTQYKYKDIFSVDQMTMYSDVCPLKIDTNPRENDDLINSATNLISILLCCNSSGTDKIPPLITGPYKCTISRDDCKYYYNENSCINDEIFIEWIVYLNRLMSEKSRRILLLLHRHRISAVGNTQLSNVKLIFFPTNFPPHLRPLRRDVFHSTKMNYRSMYAEKIFHGDSKWDLNEMIMAVLESWNQVPRELIISSFQRTTFRSDDKLLEINNDDWEKLNTGISFKKLVTFDDHLSDAPNSISINDPKQINREKHNYNLRTSNHEVFQVDELDDLSGLKNEFVQNDLRDDANLPQANDSHRDIGSMTMDVDKIDSNHLEENSTKDLENFPQEFEDNHQNSQNIPQCFEVNISKDTVENLSKDLEIISKDFKNISKDSEANFLERNSSKDLEANFSKQLIMNVATDSKNSAANLTMEEKIATNLEHKNSQDLEEKVSKDSEEKILQNLEEKNSQDLEKKISNDSDENIPEKLERNISKDLEQTDSKNLEEDGSKNSESNLSKIEEHNSELSLLGEISNSGRESSGIISDVNKNAIALFMGKSVDFLTEMKAQSISQGGNSDDKNHCQETGENSVVDINDDSNKPSTSEKRNCPRDDEDEPPEKIQTTASHWCHRFKNHYVFGPDSRVLPGPSSQNDCNRNFEIGTQTSFTLLQGFDFTKFNENQETKETSPGKGFIYTKNGKKNLKPRSPKD